MYKVSNSETAIYLAERNIDTIIRCLCEQIENQQSMIDVYRASLKRLEEEIIALKMKYEPMTDKEAAEIG